MDCHRLHRLYKHLCNLWMVHAANLLRRAGGVVDYKRRL